MMLTGKTLSAVKAKKIGLIDRIVQPIGAGVKPAEENNYDYLQKVSLFRNPSFLIWQILLHYFSVSKTLTNGDF